MVEKVLGDGEAEVNAIGAVVHLLRNNLLAVPHGYEHAVTDPGKQGGVEGVGDGDVGLEVLFARVEGFGGCELLQVKDRSVSKISSRRSRFLACKQSKKPGSYLEVNTPARG